MKLGPITLERASKTEAAIALAAKTIPRPVLTEIGGTGTLVFGSRLIQQDYNPDWAFPNAYAIIDRMRKSDATVKLGLRTIKLPLLQAEWKVEAASDSPRDREIADFCQFDIEHMSTSFKATMVQILLHLDYGSMPFETVWEARDDRKIHLRKLAPRMPATVLYWHVDDAGGLTSIEQWVPKNNAFELITIPVDKLAVFVNEREASDWRGTSLLRSAYQHWYYKTGFYKIDAIAKEKRGTGVDVASIKLGADDPVAVKRDAERAMMTMHAHEKQFVTEYEKDWAYRVEGLTGTLPDMMASIQHHDLLILRAMMAAFQALGEHGAGSWALSRDKSSYALMSLISVADLICEVWSDYVFKKLVDFNFAGVSEYPRLSHGRLDTREIAAFADAVQKLVASGALTVDQSVEDATREVLELPEFERPAEPPPPDPLNPPPPVDPNAPAPSIPPIPFARKFSRSKRPAEEHVDFALLASGMDTAQSTIIDAVRAVQAKQVKSLVELGGRILKSGERGAIEDVTVPFKGQVADAVAAELAGLYALGRREVARELTARNATIALATPDKAADEAATAYLATRARAVANVLGDRLKSSFTFAMLTALRKGETDTAGIEAVLSSLSEREIKRAAAVSVTEALNLGRQTLAAENADSIEKATFSALMDEATCGPCEEADGMEFTVGSAEYDEHEPPYQECDGRGNCRCVYVY